MVERIVTDVSNGLRGGSHFQPQPNIGQSSMIEGVIWNRLQLIVVHADHSQVGQRSQCWKKSTCLGEIRAERLEYLEIFSSASKCIDVDRSQERILVTDHPRKRQLIEDIVWQMTNTGIVQEESIEVRLIAAGVIVEDRTQSHED